MTVYRCEAILANGLPVVIYRPTMPLRKEEIHAGIIDVRIVRLEPGPIPTQTTLRDWARADSRARFRSTAATFPKEY